MPVVILSPPFSSFFFNPEFIADIHSMTFVKVTETFIKFLPKHVSAKFITFFFLQMSMGKVNTARKSTHLI